MAAQTSDEPKERNFAMKKLLPAILIFVLALAIAIPAFASGEREKQEAEPAYTVLVGLEEQKLELTDRPYEKDGVLMIPLCEVADALGLRVVLDPDTGAVTGDDDYIQGAVVTPGKASVVFTGHLQVIDMSREIELQAAAAARSGCVYVPASFFEEFFFDVTVEDGTITIAPQMAELCEVG